jgi:hypothetical protein
MIEENPYPKVTSDQMQYARTRDSIAEVPQATPTIEAAVWSILSEDKPVRQTFEEIDPHWPSWRKR